MTYPAFYLSADVLADPDPVFRELQDNDPVHFSSWLNSWVLTRFEDVEAVLKQPRWISADTVTPVYESLPEEERQSRARTFSTLRQWLPFMDPPDHRRLRRLVSRAINQSTVRGMEERIRASSADLCARLPPGEPVDLIEEYSRPLTLGVISSLLGLPAARHDEVRRAADKIYPIVHGALGHPARKQQAEDGFAELAAIFGEEAARRRQNPGDDLLSSLVGTGDDGDPLTDEEIVATCSLVVFAGQETTTSLVANGVGELLGAPDALAWLRANPAAMDTAVEEIVRFRGTAYAVTRIAVEQMDVRGRRIEPGDKLTLIIGAANRDPRRFEAPDTLQLDRHPNGHLGFGTSIHFCLGAPLARLEVMAALGDLLERFPQWELAEPGGRVQWEPMLITRQPAQLRVELR